MATFDYTSRDYLSIRQDLINRAAINIKEWDTSDASEFGNVFIDLWAYMGDVLHFYIDRAASETFLSTATQRESVLAIANLMDYSPASSRSARGTCTVKLTSFPTENVKTYTISSATVTGSYAVYTTSSNHNLTPNQLVSISGCAPTAFNITNVPIYDFPTATTFRIALTRFSSAPSGSTTTGGTLNYNLVYTIPQFTRFGAYDINNDLVDYYLSTTTTVDRANTDIVLSLIQGTIINNELLGGSSGRSNQVFTLTKANVDTDSIDVLVYEGTLSGGSPTAIQYQYVANLSSSIYADKVFTTRLTSDGYTQVIFGNGFNGAIPTTNANMTVSYRTNVGSLGNIQANKMQFIVGEPNSYLSIVSSGIFSGGSEVESIESIRNNVSRLFRTQDRAVSLQDYKDLTLQIPGVSKATATYSNSSVTIYPVPHLSVFPPAPTVGASSTSKVIIEIQEPMAESINDYFATRSMLGVTAQVINPTDHGAVDRYIECEPVYVNMQVYVKDNFVQSWIKDKVTTAIKSLLDFNLVTFGQTLTIGEVYRAALSVNGVDYVVITNLSKTFGASSVINVPADSTKLLCFTDDLVAGDAITLVMSGGITGSN